MVMTGLVRGERQTLAQWFGFVLALVGLAALLAPGVSASPVMGALPNLKPQSSFASIFFRLLIGSIPSSYAIRSAPHVELPDPGSVPPGSESGLLF